MTVGSNPGDPTDADPALPCGETTPEQPEVSRRHLQLDPHRIIEQVKGAFSPLERDLVGFGPLLIQAIYALLTRENLLVFSPAGTAKTLCAGLIFSRIRGAAVFDTQMSKGTLAEELFGSVDIEQMKRGRVTHNTRNTLVDADLAFIDEFFDANDMVLRALLGIFNERVFKKGSQFERARLHTGIAAANYLRANEVTEAVLDRFLFRALIAPDYSPFTLLAIDGAFQRHYGRQEAIEPGGQIPMEHLSYLADIVCGFSPRLKIVVPPHVLFLKNALINRYRELLGESPEADRKRPLYISPRTYAKSRVVLHAAALLRGRMEVVAEDLSQLKYAVTAVGGPQEQAECFEKALKETLVRFRPADLEHVDELVAAHDLAEQIMARVREGAAIECTGFLQRILRLFKLKSQGEITFHHLRRFIDAIEPSDEQVGQLRLGVLKRIQELTRRVDDRDRELLR
jgi:MoxR-like ATPase